MKNIFISVLLALALCPSQMKAQQNPILPGFHADPEITYSNQTHRYYIYSTTALPVLLVCRPQGVA